ncbi:uncharacterized protein LOC129747055 [Uranotaenia lowii]|uniref:uncharacterized protein LOC129747055 n=1 Tax=Uranotaenia lowii TaxID=190385 RepID=UPI002478AAF7|nr:uncharacterized protein LOC129747055 [Uranotaenia lowii]
MVDDQERLLEDFPRKGKCKLCAFHLLGMLTLVFFALWMLVIALNFQPTREGTDSAIDFGVTVIEWTGRVKTMVNMLLKPENSAREFPENCTLLDGEVVKMLADIRGESRMELLSDDENRQLVITSRSSTLWHEMAGRCMGSYLRIMKNYIDEHGLDTRFYIPALGDESLWDWFGTFYRDTPIEYGKAVELWKIGGVPVLELKKTTTILDEY